MKQDNRNRVSSIQKNLDNSLQVNPIEDGNTPVNDPRQGYMYTAEIDNSDYEQAYKFDVQGIMSLKTTTGNNNYYQLTVKFRMYDQLSNSDWFGSNILKAGDPFTLIPLIGGPLNVNQFNWVKGSIIQVQNITITTVSGPEHIVRANLLCSFSEGLSKDLPQGYDNDGFATMLTTRRIFAEHTNPSPSNLISAVNKSSQTINFYWDDLTSNAVSYRVNLRLSNNTQRYTFDVYGDTPNFNGSLKPYVRSGVVVSTKITDQGSGWSMENETPNMIVSSNVTAPVIKVHNNQQGQARISKWRIVGNNINTASNFISIVVEPLDYNILYDASFVDMNDGLSDLAFINGETAIGKYNTIIIQYPDGNPYSTLSADEFETRFFNKIIDIHSGVEIISSGSGIIKDPIFEYDKYPTTTKWVLPLSTILSQGPEWYWSVASIFDNDKKIFSEWSQEELLIVG